MRGLAHRIVHARTFECLLAAAPRIGLATLVMSFVLACGPPPPVEIAFVRWHDDVNPEIYVMNAEVPARHD